MKIHEFQEKDIFRNRGVNVPRGKVAGTEVWFEGADGTRYITTARKSLRPDLA